MGNIPMGRRFRAQITFGLVLLGPFLAVWTFLSLGPLNQSATGLELRLILLADFIYILMTAALVIARVARLISDRRSQSAGSRLHMRLSGVFALVALGPTILVAVFAVFTVSIGLEGWFSERVRSVVGSSLDAAQAYEAQSRNDLIEDGESLANYINAAKETTTFIQDNQLRPLLTRGQALVQRGLKEAFLIDGGGELRTRGERSYLFDFEPPPPNTLNRAREEGTAVIQDWANDEFRAIVHLSAFPDRYLYISRKVDGQLLSLLDETRETVRLYNELENERGQILFNFGLIYLSFAIILILAAVWLGLWFAETLSRPVGRLAGAAQKVGEGDLNVQVREEPGDDEIAMLGRLFNKMTRQLKGQRDALLDSHELTETRRRLFDSVLSNVTSGVIGLDPTGQVDFVNRPARRMLDLTTPDREGIDMAALVPEFAPLFKQLRSSGVPAMQEEIALTRHGRQENLLVRLSMRRSDDEQLEGYVLAFDDVTELVAAQRLAAWGDVARRIAHEIKNPLTPIALSAERIKRKFQSQVEAPEDLIRYADVIIRQTNDLRRIVNEFSNFARMPEPELRETDLCHLVEDAITLQENGQPGITFRRHMPNAAIILPLDPTMISQALTNLMKNAGEAIESLQQAGHNPPDFTGQICIELKDCPLHAVIRIMDNGVGLPPERGRLFEPYVTTRKGGTGLGLSIVKKIIEEHGGSLVLDSPSNRKPNDGPGAIVEIRLPRAANSRHQADSASDTVPHHPQPPTIKETRP